MGATISKGELFQPHLLQEIFNKVKGNIIDITREQYEIARIPVSYDENEEISRSELASDEERAERYKLLLKRISEYLA